MIPRVVIAASQSGVALRLPPHSIQRVLTPRLFAPGILEGDGAVEDGFGAGLVVDAVGDEITDPFELAGKTGIGERE